MIHYIEIENFYSISEKQIIDFRHKPLKNDINNLLSSRGYNKVLIPPVIALFGANASGKTTVLRAIASVLHLTNLSRQDGLPKISELFSPNRSQYWINKPTKITIVLDGIFYEDGNLNNQFDTTFKYEIEIDNYNRHESFVSYEKLSHSKEGKRYEKLFERNLQNFSFSKSFSHGLSKLISEVISKETVVLGRASIFNHAISSKLIDIMNGITTNVRGIFKTSVNNDLLAKYYHLNTEKISQINEVLPRFDLGINEMSVKNAANNINFIEISHTNLIEKLHFYEESKGTQNFIELFPLLMQTLETGGIAVIDELDNEIHPMLLPEIVEWFYDSDKNKYNAQLIFTAHNAILMNHLDLNQIYLTEKQSDKGTIVYCARDIKGARADINYLRQYLSGELGGVPIIG